jgi:acetyl esterase/lipase
VRGVVSYYGPTDLRVYFRHAGVINPEDEETLELLNKLSGFRSLAHSEMVTNMTGGVPDQVPEMYDLLSPITHVGHHCPPTLLLQGEHDSMTSALAVRAMYQKLVEHGAKAIYVEFPQTEHGFDVALHFFGLGRFSQSAPASQAALYDVERFLALLI